MTCSMIEMIQTINLYMHLLTIRNLCELQITWTVLNFCRQLQRCNFHTIATWQSFFFKFCQVAMVGHGAMNFFVLVQSLKFYLSLLISNSFLEVLINHCIKPKFTKITQKSLAWKLICKCGHIGHSPNSFTFI